MEVHHWIKPEFLQLFMNKAMDLGGKPISTVYTYLHVTWMEYETFNGKMMLSFQFESREKGGDEYYEWGLKHIQEIQDTTK
jgi:hypothetical protein